MKKYYTLLLLFIICLANAQNGITYQAVILNPNSEELPGADNSRLPMINQSICLDFKIINAASQVDYQETLTTKTDEFGMVNVIIGTGTRKAGIATLFKNINWDGTAKNLVVSFDPTGNCNQFIEISNQPFTYVPYALYAANGGATGPQGPAGPAGTIGLDGKTVLNGTTNPSASFGTNGDFYINTTTNNIFGPKANNLWGNGVLLIGPQGVAGTNGLNGTNGIDGLSAYQIWLNAGNTGTQAQFLTALRGATGATGLLPNGTTAGITTYWNGSQWEINSSNLYNNGGNIGIGTTNPTSKLNVNGAATNTTAYNAGNSSTIDFSLSNLAYSSSIGNSFTLENLKDGGAYSLILTGTTNIGTIIFNATGLTFKYMGTIGMVSGKAHIYSFIVAGNIVYVSMAIEN